VARRASAIQGDFDTRDRGFWIYFLKSNWSGLKASNAIDKHNYNFLFCHSRRLISGESVISLMTVAKAAAAAIQAMMTYEHSLYALFSKPPDPDLDLLLFVRLPISNIPAIIWRVNPSRSEQLSFEALSEGQRLLP
jgi:hypothetical protein